jgi:hypothetical protein
MESPYPTSEQEIYKRIEILEEQVAQLTADLEMARKAFITLTEKVNGAHYTIPLEFSAISSIVLTSMIDLYTFAYAQMSGYSGEKKSQDEILDQALDHIRSILIDMEKQQFNLPEEAGRSNVIRMFNEAIKHAKLEKKDQLIKGRLADVVE